MSFIRLRAQLMWTIFKECRNPLCAGWSGNVPLWCLTIGAYVGSQYDHSRLYSHVFLVIVSLSFPQITVSLLSCYQSMFNEHFSKIISIYNLELEKHSTVQFIPPLIYPPIIITIVLTLLSLNEMITILIILYYFKCWLLRLLGIKFTEVHDINIP